MKNIIMLLVWINMGAAFIMCSKKADNPTDPGVQDGFTLTKTNFNGWSDSYELSNGTVKVVVVPAIGRIMHYGLINGKNILWNDAGYAGKTLPTGQPYRENGSITWANFGGDKVWPTEQDKFPDINGYAWPPDHWFDGNAHQVEEIANGIKITSMLSDFCGARCIREITLADSGSELSIKQTIRKEKRARKSSVEPIEYTVWNVTQIRNPLAALLNLNPATTLTDGMRFWSDQARSFYARQGSVGIFTPSSSASLKVGADSDHWLGAVVDNMVFGEFFRRQPGIHPDGDLSAEVYTSPQYTELELLSPLTKLSIGQEIHHDIVWRLTALPANAITKDEKVQTAAQWLDHYIQ
ncbi:MAG: hypothetical protein EHM72_13465 [Calditrichaeota bacterium]|nr:MAG: hypothetical protein EHM72_13465 [Calditrichota bacterium]